MEFYDRHPLWGLGTTLRKQEREQVLVAAVFIIVGVWAILGAIWRL